MLNWLTKCSGGLSVPFAAAAAFSIPVHGFPKVLRLDGVAWLERDRGQTFVQADLHRVHARNLLESPATSAWLDEVAYLVHR
jgi:hypothetical protein